MDKASSPSHLDPRLSIVTGDSYPALQDTTLGQLLDQCNIHHGANTAVVSLGGRRLTYTQLRDGSRKLAAGLLAMGIRRGDKVAIYAGNCPEYVELLFATGIIGAILVVMNNFYSPEELRAGLHHADCRALFAAPIIGTQDKTSFLKSAKLALPQLDHIILLEDHPEMPPHFPRFEAIMTADSGSENTMLKFVDLAQRQVRVDDICNMQFTSGTTGSPKAVMLSHHNIINNGDSIGNRLNLTSEDIICNPTPLFHCFGLVLALLAGITHGSAIVLPNETFSAAATLRAIEEENCTVLHGVPTMFSNVLEELQARRIPLRNATRLRTGIVGGAACTQRLYQDIREALHLPELTLGYGMTETSPVSFMTRAGADISHCLDSVGNVMPHVTAKVVDASGNIVSRGSRGELHVAGYGVQHGYYKNEEKTAEAIYTDISGKRWMRTGDEATIDAEGICRITGRIKDIIIRGGENIYPQEIEAVIIQHPAVMQVSVVGLEDRKYGEVVAAFLIQAHHTAKPADSEIREWVRQRLGKHKVPIHVWWTGDARIGDKLPQTGSGKIEKHKLQKLGNQIIETQSLKSKL